MLIVLGLIDVVMISNQLVMVIVGGYETFVSRLGLQGHPDQPEWLSHVNASVLKVKLAMAIIGISSIHLLKTFIEAGRSEEHTSELQSLMRISYAVFCLKKKITSYFFICLFMLSSYFLSFLYYFFFFFFFFSFFSYS